MPRRNRNRHIEEDGRIDEEQINQQNDRAQQFIEENYDQEETVQVSGDSELVGLSETNLRANAYIRPRSYTGNN